MGFPSHIHILGRNYASLNVIVVSIQDKERKLVPWEDTGGQKFWGGTQNGRPSDHILVKKNDAGVL